MISTYLCLLLITLVVVSACNITCGSVGHIFSTHRRCDWEAGPTDKWVRVSYAGCTVFKDAKTDLCSQIVHVESSRDSTLSDLRINNMLGE